MLNGAEVAKHSSRESCWVVLYGHAYDVTDFLDSHPGGANAILRYAGRDATEEYDPIHAPGLLEQHLPAVAYLGEVDPATIIKPQKQSQVEGLRDAVPPLSSLINLDDFEKVAKQHLVHNGWFYYASAADDEIIMELNRKAFQKVYLRPRVMRNVELVDTRTAILGEKASMPVFVSPAALARLAHPEGECAIAAGVGNEGLIQVVSTSSSMSIESIMSARVSNDQPVFFQLYVNKDIEKSKATIRRVEKAGVKALWITVDSPVIGKREQDERFKAQIQISDENGGVNAGQEVTGIARTMGSVISPRVTWDDLVWVRETTALPLVIKGIQCVEDAILAFQHGVQGIVLSNHGGRSQDTSQAPLLTLLEIRKYAPFLFQNMEIYIDGGIRRGTDVLKALALGATAVGLGRPFLYSLAAGYGEAGVRRLVSIVRGELVANMALAGATSLAEITPQMLNTKRLERDLYSMPRL